MARDGAALTLYLPRMGNRELHPQNARSVLRRPVSLVMLAALFGVACNGPTREYYEPAEVSAGGIASSNGGATTTSVGGSSSNTALGGASGSGSAVGGISGASGASTVQGGASSSGASGLGGATDEGGATGASGATNVGGASSLGGAISVAGAQNVGGASPAGGIASVGGTVSVGGALPNGGTLSLGGAVATGGVGGGSVDRPLGAPCATATECTSTICADGVCCSSACNGSCQACDTAGTCQRVVMREDNSCRTDATGTRMCDAQSVCSMPHLIRDVNPVAYTLAGVTNTNPSYPRGFTQGPDRRVYFSASDGTAGEELWVTDGTASGTLLVADLIAGIGNSSPRGLINASGNLFFSASNAAGYQGLYATNGTAAGTHLVKDLGNSAFGGNSLSAVRNAGNLIYFSACNSTVGCELWRSDGTDTGTVMVKDIMNTLVNTTTTTQTFGSNPSELAIMSNVVYFRAASAIVGLGTSNTIADYELWRSDGIANNTVRVADVEPGVGNGMPTYLTPMQTLNGPKLLFAASRGASNQELYFTNGTMGDLASYDIYPGATGSYPGPFVAMGNRTYFPATDPTNGSELWATDGTPAGTYLVKDIYPGTAGSSPSLMKAAGNFLYFRASDSAGSGVWRSDGTSNGTTKVFSTLLPTSASLFQMAAFANSVFMCTAGTGTQELWITDGTAAGSYRTCPDRTQPCGVPFPGNPSDLTVIDGRMYFNATALPTVGGSLGAEPYVYP